MCSGRCVFLLSSNSGGEALMWSVGRLLILLLVLMQS